MNILAEYNLPFAAALILMLLIAIAQIFGLGDLIGDADADADFDTETPDGAGEGLLALLGIGRVDIAKLFEVSFCSATMRLLWP